MSDNERAIDAAISAEEDALLRSFGEEPPYMKQLLGIFSGKTGWVSLVMMAAQLVLFCFGTWAAIRFFAAEDPLTALKWGLPAAVLLIMSLMIKLALWPVIHVNKLIGQIHKLELTVLRPQERHLS